MTIVHLLTILGELIKSICYIQNNSGDNSQNMPMKKRYAQISYIFFPQILYLIIWLYILINRPSPVLSSSTCLFLLPERIMYIGLLANETEHQLLIIAQLVLCLCAAHSEAHHQIIRWRKQVLDHLGIVFTVNQLKRKERKGAQPSTKDIYDTCLRP